MILVADSGSSTATWVFCEAGIEQNRIVSPGINPRFMDISAIIKCIREELYYNTYIPTEIYYYGAGCGTIKMSEIMKAAFKEIYPLSDVFIETDMLGAARGLWGKEVGLAAILGTGSNCAFYDGEKCHNLKLSAGYILGDEGSGAVIGRQFMSLLLKNKLPSEIFTSFNERYKLSTGNILDTVYNKAFPNRFLASFLPFLHEHIDNNFVKELIFQSFTGFFDEQFYDNEDYKKYGMKFCGSVAYYFADILREASEKAGLNIISIDQNPVSGLINYHGTKNSEIH